MTKKITISLNDDIFDWLNQECINRSALINAILRQKMNKLVLPVIPKLEENNLLSPQETKVKLSKEEEEIFNVKA